VDALWPLGRSRLEPKALLQRAPANETAQLGDEDTDFMEVERVRIVRLPRVKSFDRRPVVTAT
jgi:hypothetical protein